MGGVRRRAHAELVAIHAELERRRALASPESFIPHEPTPKQTAFLSLDCFEALYGGAAGGGKSDALLMAAAQYVHIPGYAALLLRRTYADLSLPGAIMDRSKSWWMGKADWNEKDKRWTFPSGATITFGYLDTEKDRFRYQGAELQFLGFDELTQFPEQWYRYLQSRLRRLSTAVAPVRCRAASNPGGIGHDWVRRRFVDEPVSGCAFVPATLVDNPYIDAELYRANLERLDPTTRAQLLDGIWIRDSGGLVYRFDETKNRAAAIPSDLKYHLLGIDYGFTDATAFAVLGWRDHDTTIYGVRCYKKRGLTPSDAAAEAKALERQYDCLRVVGDIGGLGKGYAEEARTRFALPVEPAEKKNKRGYIDLLNGDLARGRIQLMAGANKELEAEWHELPWTEDRAKEADGFDNHCADAFLYAWRACVAYHELPEEKPPAKGTREADEAEEREIFQRRIQDAERRRSREWWEDS